MADTLTPLQLRVLCKLRNDIRKADYKSVNGLYSASECAMLVGMDERSFYRVLESLENKKMISWKDHKFKNLRMLRKGFGYKGESVYECKAPEKVEQGKKNKDWEMGFLLFLFAGIIILAGLISTLV